MEGNRDLTPEPCARLVDLKNKQNDRSLNTHLLNLYILFVIEKTSSRVHLSIKNNIELSLKSSKMVISGIMISSL